MDHLQPEGMSWTGVHERVLHVALLDVAGVLSIHGSEHEAVVSQEVGEGFYAFVVQVGVDAPVMEEVEVAHSIHAVNVPCEIVIVRQKPGVMHMDEVPVFLVGPQFMPPIRKTFSPRGLPPGEALRKLVCLPALMDHFGRNVIIRGT